MSQEEVKALVDGDYVIDVEMNKTFKVSKFYKSGVLLYEQWENDFGVFVQNIFVRYSDLFTKRYRSFEEWLTMNG